MKSGIDLIADERKRQIEKEHRTAEHDSTHQDEELVFAAISYALPETERNTNRWPHYWPWGIDSWKPTSSDRVRELVKAGALLAAEIDRLTALTRGSGVTKIEK